MDHQPGDTHKAPPLDPENDIDAKSVTIWFVGTAVVLFIALWIMLPIFLQVLDEEQMRKVNLSPTTEFNELDAAETEFLNGKNPTSKNIDDVVNALRR